MPDTSTPNYALIKPEVGASDDTWGAKHNTNQDTLDTAVKAVSDVANAALPKAGGTATGKMVWFTSTTGAASFQMPAGADPSSPVTGDMWAKSDGVYYRLSGGTKMLAFVDGDITGNAATATLAVNATNAASAAQATKLATARTIALTGNVTGSASFDGSSNISIATTLGGIYGTLLASGNVATGSGNILDVDFSGYSGYTRFEIILDNLAPSLADPVQLRYSTNGGTSFISTNSYAWGNARLGSSYAWTSNGGLESSIRISPSIPWAPNILVIEVLGIGTSSVIVRSRAHINDSGSGTAFGEGGLNQSGVNAVRVFWNSKTTVSGTYRLVGYP